MSMPAEKRRYSIEDYLRIERDSSAKHEFHDGEILAMSGGTATHSLIASNVIRELGNALKGKRCRVYDSNLRVRISGEGIYVYPDATIICGPPQFDSTDTKGETVINPRVLVEVLSPTTEAYDRGKKFDHYRQIETLQEYILISQDSPIVETFLRQADGSWLFTAFSGLQATAKIKSLEIDLPLAEVFADVEFPPPAPPPPDIAKTI